MACEGSFIDCVGNAPVSGLPTYFNTSTGIIIFIINAALYLMNGALLIWLIYNLVKGIYLMVKEDNQANFATASKVFSYSLLAGLGIVLLQNANWIGSIVLKTLGVPDAENVFMHVNLVGLN